MALVEPEDLVGLDFEGLYLEPERLVGLYLEPERLVGLYLEPEDLFVGL